MRVAFVITSLETGGAEMMLFRLISRLSSRFHPHVFSLTRGGEVENEIRKLGVSVESLALSSSIPSPARMGWLTGRLRELRPRLVQTWLYHADLLGTLAALMARVPCSSWNLRCSALNPKETPLTTRLIVRLLARMSRVPEVVVANSLEGKRVHEALGYKPRRWEIIPNGFDMDTFRSDSNRRASARKALGLRQQDIAFGVVARYHPMKDHSNLLRAAAQVVKENPQARFILVGSGVTEGNRDLLGPVEMLDLRNKTLLLGERHDVSTLMTGFDCLVSSSAWGEGFPNVVAEAMACELPCIVTDVGDSARIVGETGWVVPPRAPQALSERMLAFSRLPTEARASLGQAARARVARDYSLDAVVGQYEDLFHELGA